MCSILCKAHRGYYLLLPPRDWTKTLLRNLVLKKKFTCLLSNYKYAML